MGFLTRDEILGAVDLKVVEVAVPEWGGTVRVSMMTGTERDAFEAETVVRKGKRVEVNMVNMRARLVARTVVDEKGARVFSDGDVEALAAKSPQSLHLIDSSIIRAHQHAAGGKKGARITPLAVLVED